WGRSRGGASGGATWRRPSRS
ncbi:MAG: hypothetical protein AVDCRST_MAG30-1785, partial [uncultured Solirubrobacteraceae bacterium]